MGSKQIIKDPRQATYTNHKKQDKIWIYAFFDGVNKLEGLFESILQHKKENWHALLTNVIVLRAIYLK